MATPEGARLTNLKRYDVGLVNGEAGCRERPNGPWVYFKDVQAEIERLQHSSNPRETEYPDLSAEINALPDLLRRYVHDLETDADPAGDKWRLLAAEQNIAGLSAEIERLREESKAEYNRGFAVGSGDEGHYQREITRLRAALSAAEPCVDIALDHAHPRQKDHFHKILVQVATALQGAAVEPSEPLCITCGAHHRSPWEPCPKCGEIHHPDSTCGPAMKSAQLHAKGCPCPTCMDGTTRSNIEQKGFL